MYTFRQSGLTQKIAKMFRHKDAPGRLTMGLVLHFCVPVNVYAIISPNTPPPQKKKSMHRSSESAQGRQFKHACQGALQSGYFKSL